MSNIYIGTSGFSYPHWKGNFYPADLPQGKWFAYYCQHFATVELNVSFYRLPKKEAFASWRKQAGPGPPAGGFTFAIKGSRFITHIKKLKDVEQPVRIFFETAAAIKGERDVVLWQLPPGWAFNENRLKDFLALLPKNWKHAFEFRSSTWFTINTYKLLQKYKAAIVFQDYPDWPITEKVTADFVYLRFHGKTSLYSSCYTKRELNIWAEKIKSWQKKGLDVYAYFNNDALGYATQNAQTLKELCAK